jgi:hypothetical protein
MMTKEYFSKKEYDRLSKEAWAKIHESKLAKYQTNESINTPVKLYAFDSVDSLMKWIDSDDHEIT